MGETYTCVICHEEFPANETYEHRGMHSCGPHADEMREKREFQRAEIIAEENARLAPLKGLDIDPRNVIGRVNRSVLAAQIEIAGKESQRLKDYERPTPKDAD